MILSIQRKNNNNKQAWNFLPGFVVIYRYKKSETYSNFYQISFFMFHILCKILYSITTFYP